MCTGVVSFIAFLHTAFTSASQATFAQNGDVPTPIQIFSVRGKDVSVLGDECFAVRRKTFYEASRSGVYTSSLLFLFPLLCYRLPFSLLLLLLSSLLMKSLLLASLLLLLLLLLASSNEHSTSSRIRQAI